MKLAEIETQMLGKKSNYAEVLAARKRKDRVKTANW